MQKRKKICKFLSVLAFTVVLCLLVGCRKKLQEEHAKVKELHKIVFEDKRKEIIEFGTEDKKPEDIEKGKFYLKMSEEDYEALKKESLETINSDVSKLEKDKIDKLIAKLSSVNFIVGTKPKEMYDDKKLDDLANVVFSKNVIYDSSKDAANLSSSKFLYKGSENKDELFEKYSNKTNLTISEKKQLEQKLQAIKDALVPGTFTPENAKGLIEQVKTLANEVLSDNVLFLNQELVSDELAKDKYFVKGEPALKEQLKAKKEELVNKQVEDLFKEEVEQLVNKLTELKATKVLGTFDSTALLNEIRVLVNKLTDDNVVYNELARQSAEFPKGYSHVMAKDDKKQSIKDKFNELETNQSNVTKQELINFKQELEALTYTVGEYDYQAAKTALEELHNIIFSTNSIYSEDDLNAADVNKGLNHIKTNQTTIDEKKATYDNIITIDPKKSSVKSQLEELTTFLRALKVTNGAYDTEAVKETINTLKDQVLNDNVLFEEVDKTADVVNKGFSHIKAAPAKKAELLGTIENITNKTLKELKKVELENLKTQLTTLQAGIVIGTYDFQVDLNKVNALKNEVLNDDVDFGLEAKTADIIMKGRFYIQEDPAKKAQYISKVVAINKIVPGYFVKSDLEALKNELEVLKGKMIAGSLDSTYNLERIELYKMLNDKIFNDNVVWDNKDLTAEQVISGLAHVKTDKFKTDVINALIALKAKSDAEFIDDYNAQKAIFDAIKATYIEGTYDHTTVLNTIKSADTSVLQAVWYEEDRDEDGMKNGKTYIKGSSYEKEILTAKVNEIKAQTLTQYDITQLEAVAALVNEYKSLLKEGKATLLEFTYSHPSGYKVDYEVVRNGIVYIKKIKYTGSTILERIDIPNVITHNGITYMIEGMLANATSQLKKVKIVDLASEDNSLLSFIGDNNFQNIQELENVFLPTSIEYIGEGFLKNCPNIKTVEHEGLKYLDNDSADEMSYLVCLGFAGAAREVVDLHPNTRIIVAEAFKDQTTITEVKINDMLTHIAKNAFAGTTNLLKEKIKFIDSPYLLYISDLAFKGSGVTEIKSSDVPHETKVSKYAC